MAVRDRVVLVALGAGAVLGLLSWRLAGPWVALIVGLLALGIAAVTYRIEAPRIDVDHPETWDPRASGRSAGVDRPAERVDQ